MTDSSWGNGTLVGFDTETTGVDMEKDRIVSACVIIDEADGQSSVHNFLINPGVPIPEGATAIHGITDEMVAAEGGDPKTVLAELREVLLSAPEAPLVAYNAVFDLTIIDRELRRNGLDPLPARPVIDPLVLDKKVNRYVSGAGQRKLTPTAARYGVKLVDAHNAQADVRAVLDLAREIAKRGKVSSDAVKLTAQQVLWYADDAASYQAWRRKKQAPDEEPIVIDTIWPIIPA